MRGNYFRNNSRAELRNQASQGPPIDGVPFLAGGVLFLGGFQVHGDLAEPLVAEQQAEGLQAELPFANVLVPVDAGAELALAVVEMDGLDQADADGLVELLPGGLEFVRRP